MLMCMSILYVSYSHKKIHILFNYITKKNKNRYMQIHNYFFFIFISIILNLRNDPSFKDVQITSVQMNSLVVFILFFYLFNL